LGRITALFQLNELLKRDRAATTHESAL